MDLCFLALPWAPGLVKEREHVRGAEGKKSESFSANDAARAMPGRGLLGSFLSSPLIPPMTLDVLFVITGP